MVDVVYLTVAFRDEPCPVEVDDVLLVAFAM
jgi:hypothetical protein